MVIITKYNEINQIKNECVKKYIQNEFNNVYKTGEDTYFKNVKIEDIDFNNIGIGRFVYIENDNDLKVKNDLFFHEYISEYATYEWFKKVILDDGTELADALHLENDEGGNHYFINLNQLNNENKEYLEKIIEKNS